MGKYWEVVYDDENSKIEVIGQSNDDTLLTYNVSEMQRAGMKVHCNAPDVTNPESNITLTHYQREVGLYSHLLGEYQKKTGKQLKRW